MLQNFAYYAQIMLYTGVYVSQYMLRKFNIFFLLSYLKHKIMNIGSIYLFILQILCNLIRLSS